MDKVDEARVADLGARLERLETEHNRAPVRGVVGGGVVGLNIQTVHVLPALPAKKTIVFLEGDPTPSAKDLYWWAAKNDDRWHPIGGKITGIAGDPGDTSEA